MVRHGALPHEKLFLQSQRWTTSLFAPIDGRLDKRGGKRASLPICAAQLSPQAAINQS